ncbi:MAG: hypothetical protein RIE86_14240 [Imperialibacter sp.]|uniref:hypothetical protein n=1 Tax=Imperialibacter sp. TaxID=2038411 RepID=UPI0032EF16F9
MIYTKNIFRSLLLAGCICLLPSLASASVEDGSEDKSKDNKEQCDQEDKDKKAAEAAVVKEKPKAVNYTASSQKSREIVPGLSNKADSSSVLSYNFIFYLVYKFKYSESEEGFSQESRTTD